MPLLDHTKLSYEADLIYRRLGNTVPECRAYKNRLTLAIGETTLTLCSDIDSVSQSLEQRYVPCSPISNTASVIAVNSFQTAETDFAIRSPYRLILAKQSGEYKVFFGAYDLSTLEKIAGSIGDYSDDDERTPMLHCLLETEILHCVTQQAPSMTFLHGAVIANETRGTIVLGQSRSGKSTLATALAMQGSTLLSDDIVCIHLADGALFPFPRRPRVRKAGQVLLNQDWPGKLDGVRIQFDHDIEANIFPNIAVQQIVVLDGFAQTPELQRLHTKEALWALMSACVMQSTKNRPRLMTQLADLSRRCDTYSLKVGNLEDTVRVIQELNCRS